MAKRTIKPSKQKHSAPESSDASSVPSFTEWELMTEQQRHDWINQRGAELVAAGWVDVFKIELTDCPRIPGQEMDEWLAGYFDAARDHEEQSSELDSVYVSEQMAQQPEPEPQRPG